MSDRALLIEEMVGWRTWHVLERPAEPVRLSSVGHVALWPYDRWAVARCEHGCEEVPGEECESSQGHGCGIYAMRSRQDLDVRVDRLPDDYREKCDVYGQVALAGKVIPGELGYRAARARIVRLYLPYAQWELAAALRDAYGVAVELVSGVPEEEEL